MRVGKLCAVTTPLAATVLSASETRGNDAASRAAEYQAELEN